MLKETFGWNAASGNFFCRKVSLSGGRLRKLLKVSLRKPFKLNFTVDIPGPQNIHTICIDCCYILCFCP